MSLTIRTLLGSIFLPALCFGLFIGYLQITTTETTYKCEGTARYTTEFIQEYGSGGKNPDRSSIGYLKVSEYSRLVKLWSDSRFDVWWEDSTGFLAYFNDVRDLGEALQLYEGDKYLGRFSNISNAFSLDDGTEIFEGNCELRP
jgi:hypothetical protein